jgi:GTPase SAR1 family protein
MKEYYTRSGQGFLLAYDVTSRSSFTEIPSLRSDILAIKDVPRAPMVIAGNKAELEKERQVSTSEGVAVAKEFGCPFLECSAKTRMNIEEVFFELVREIQRERGPIEKKSKGKSSNKSCSLL